VDSGKVRRAKGIASVSRQGRKCKTLTPKEVERMVRARADGLTLPVLAKRFGVSEETIRRYLGLRKEPRK
jgi:DNA-binding transcriptional regulator YiaG